MDEVAMLQWLCDMMEAPPPGLREFSDEARARIRAHRIECRILHKLKAQPAEWMNKPLAALQESHKYFLDNIAARMAVLSEVCRARPDLKVIVVKGFSTFVATSDVNFLRYSNDLDLLTDRPHDLMQSLTALSFVPDKVVSVHEYANFRRGEIPVEIHRHFPCWVLPQDVPRAAYTGSANPGIWKQPFAMTRYPITFDEVIPHCTTFALPKGGSVFVPDVTLALILTSAHAFRDYMSFASIYGRCRPRVRLGDLAECVGLVQHPSFEPAKFAKLVKRFSAYDAVEWADQMLGRCLGKRPLSHFASVASPRGHRPNGEAPRHIWGDFLALVDLPQGAMFHRGLPVGTIVQQLGGNVVRANGATYSTHQQTCALGLARVLVKPSNETSISVDCSFRRAGSALLVELSVSRKPAGRADRIRLDFGEYAFEWDCAVEGRRTVTREHLPCGTEGSFAAKSPTSVNVLSDEPNQYRVRFEVQTDDLALQEEPGGIPMLLGIGLLGPGAELNAGMLVPLHVNTA